MHVTYQALNTTHQHSATCQRGARSKARRQQLQQRRRARQVVFHLKEEEMEPVTVFRYLGRLMHYALCRAAILSSKSLFVGSSYSLIYLWSENQCICERFILVI